MSIRKILWISELIQRNFYFRRLAERSHSFVITGNFATAKITGTMRILLDEELRRLSECLTAESQNSVAICPGWIFAITDCDEVCYYVERMLTFEQLSNEEG